MPTDRPSRSATAYDAATRRRGQGLVHGAVLVAALAAAALPAASAGRRTVAADAFVDSVGVNVHLHYNDTLYRDDFPLVKERLVALGVRHVRDGLVDTKWQPYFDRHNALGKAGIKGTFITSPEQGLDLWAGYPARMHDTFEAYEAPNEYDIKSKRRDWVEALTATLKRLRQLKDDPRAARFPVYGPSLTSARAYTALGDVSAYVDFANLHNYFAGRHPGTRGWGSNGYGSIGWNLDLAHRSAPGKPVVTTETGYQDSPSVDGSAPPEVAGRYMPRLLLEQFDAGIVRTYLYELADFHKSGSYGLLDATGAPKPAFTAVKGLLNLLADPGPAFTPANLDYRVEGGSANLRDMAFGKRDDTYFVALWLSRPSYDPETRKALAVPAERAAVVLPSAMCAVRTHAWQIDGTVRTAPAAGAKKGAVEVDVADRLVVVEVARCP